MPKVSELPSATTPLDGDEYLIVVQNGATKKVPASEAGLGGGATPGGSSNEIQVNNAGSLGGATNVTAGSGYIGIGAAPATTGAIRLANNTYIYALDTDGVTDRRIIGLTNGDAVVVGGIGVDLYLGGNGTGQSINGAADTYNFRSGDSGSLFATLTATGLALRDSSGGQFYTFIPSNLAADRSITLPLLGANDTLVCEAHTQTLTNKTLGSGTAVTYTTISATGNARYQPSADIASVQTTDGTVATLFSFTPTDEAVTLLTVECLAIRSTGAEVNSYIRRVKIKRDGGTVTLGTVVDVSSDEETAAWDCTVDLSGTTVRVRITGEAGKTIDWGCTATRQVLTHA